jgi:hypothetical protein
MARFATVGVFVLVVSFFVLPLYEFADVGEHWPHDGDYVSMILTLLFFVGLTLILRRSTSAASRRLAASQCRDSGHFRNGAPESVQPPSAERPRGPADLLTDAIFFPLIEPPRFLILQDFRI